jgi:hypothetical protein
MRIDGLWLLLATPTMNVPPPWILPPNKEEFPCVLEVPPVEVEFREKPPVD